MKYEVVSGRAYTHGEWRVEAIDESSEGECYVAVFTGPFARERAEEYADFKNAQAGKVIVR